jgi:hypothetical protein
MMPTRLLKRAGAGPCVAFLIAAPNAHALGHNYEARANLPAGAPFRKAILKGFEDISLIGNIGPVGGARRLDRAHARARRQDHQADEGIHDVEAGVRRQPGCIRDFARTARRRAVRGATAQRTSEKCDAAGSIHRRQHCHPIARSQGDERLGLNTLPWCQ